MKVFLTSKNIEVCGIEISETSEALGSARWTKDVAFLLGNEGTGLSEKQKTICDRMVFIPQYSNATASLNVAVAASIVFYEFATRSGREVAKSANGKYEVDQSAQVHDETFDQPSRPKVSSEFVIEDGGIPALLNNGDEESCGTSSSKFASGRCARC